MENTITITREDFKEAIVKVIGGICDDKDTSGFAGFAISSIGMLVSQKVMDELFGKEENNNE